MKDFSDYKTVGVRRFNELQAGDIFKATIHNIRPNEVTIRFSDGNTYTARSYVLPEARIGEESLFVVQENDLEGRIVLKMVKIAPEILRKNMLTQALLNAGLAPTPQSSELAYRILMSGLPADTPTLQRAVALLAELGIDEIIALLLEEIPETQKNVPPPARFTFDMRV
ncbi:MAG: hypothetical protein FWG87_14445 [Defluviitaleaceae bacterium]|nr:hypothetical protein [Defluviitaleaceae bacterium]